MLKLPQVAKLPRYLRTNHVFIVPIKTDICQQKKSINLDYFAGITIISSGMRGGRMVNGGRVYMGGLIVKRIGRQRLRKQIVFFSQKMHGLMITDESIAKV